MNRSSRLPDRPSRRPQQELQTVTVWLPNREDLDYVVAFKALAESHELLEQTRPSAPALARCSALAFAAGDYMQAASWADEAARSQPTLAEAHFQRALAYLALAGVRAGAIPLGPGSSSNHIHSLPPAEMLLHRAIDGFVTTLMLNAEDEDAKRLLEHAQRVLSQLEEA